MCGRKRRVASGASNDAARLVVATAAQMRETKAELALGTVRGWSVIRDQVNHRSVINDKKKEINKRHKVETYLMTHLALISLAISMA